MLCIKKDNLLTPKLIDILSYIMAGHSNETIKEKLGIQDSNYSNYIKTLIDKKFITKIDSTYLLHPKLQVFSDYMINQKINNFKLIFEFYT
jgi:DNA-binding IclR family transcriptional regulator